MIGEFQTSVEKSINEIHKLGKISRQVALNAQLSQSISTSRAENRGTSLSKTKTDGAVHYEQPLSGIETIISNIKTVIRGGEKSSFQRQQSDSEAVQETSSITDTNTESLQKTQGINLSQSVEEIEKTAQAIEAILDRHLKRFEMGHGAGLWQCLTSVFADNDVHADEIANLFTECCQVRAAVTIQSGSSKQIGLSLFLMPPTQSRSPKSLPIRSASHPLHLVA